MSVLSHSQLALLLITSIDGGAYAEYIAVSTKMLIHKPPHMSWEESASLPESWLTATQALYLVGEFVEGKSVLFHAAASTVSIAGIQLAKAGGASAIYSTSSKEKINFCLKLGASAGFDRRQNWVSEVLEVTGSKGVDIVIGKFPEARFQIGSDCLF